jgi:hypothetical protein
MADDIEEEGFKATVTIKINFECLPDGDIKMAYQLDAKQRISKDLVVSALSMICDEMVSNNDKINMSPATA